MNRFYLLTAHDHYYPEAGDHDWIDCYETYEQARTAVVEIEASHGGKKYQILKPNGKTIECDYFEIIDLREWIQNTSNENKE